MDFTRSFCDRPDPTQASYRIDRKARRNWSFVVDDGSRCQAPIQFMFFARQDLSNPRLIRLDDSPKCAEKEGNNSIASANSLELPCGVCGTFVAGGPVTVYSFQATER